MAKEDLIKKVSDLTIEFSNGKHGSSNYHEQSIFIVGDSKREFAPLSYIKKEASEIKDLSDLQELGYVYSAQDYMDNQNFKDWYQEKFSRKLTIKVSKNIGLVYRPDNKRIFDAVEVIHKSYEALKDCHVLMNGKNLPVQLGEWFSKIIFGLKQMKSSSQRGFDFYLDNGKKVEVKVHWTDQSSPKGVKLKKSLVELSDYTIVMYIAKNFMIRDILFLDSDFLIRKFSGKGHTIFLKDGEVSGYFFSKSSKHFDKIVHETALMKFANPTLAVKLVDLQEKQKRKSGN